MSQWSHGETRTNRQSTGGESTAKSLPAPPRWKNCEPRKRCCSRPCVGNPGANGGHPGRGSGPQSHDCSSACASGYGPGRRGPDGGAGSKALLSAPSKKRSSWRRGPRQAKEAGLLVLSPIRAALAQRLGRPVAASVVWRLLARHGWRQGGPGHAPPPRAIRRRKRRGKKNSSKRWLPR